MKIYIKLLFLILLSVPAFAQNSLPLFQKGERICFVGNSITHAGEFHHNILLYYVTRFPYSPVTIYNCGISGDVTSQVLNRMDADILIHQPTCAVIMIGMNDVARSLYPPKLTTNADTLKKRQIALTSYRKNLETLVKTFLDKKIRVILQKPSIYDQTAKISHYNNYGSNDALKTCSDYMKEIADQYHLVTIDYFTILSSINLNLQKADSSATIIGADRIHPGPAGNLVMAYQFLKTTGAPQYVSKIVIQKDIFSSQQLSYNCILNNVKIEKNSISFKCKEASLPFPIIAKQNAILEMIPFSKDLNTELLQVNNLNAGLYKLSIDSVEVGNFTGDMLKKGINLAIIVTTPAYQQALQVRKILAELWQIESNLRNVRLIEYNYLKNFRDKQNMTAVKNYLDSLATLRYANNINMKTQLNNYTLNKAMENELESKSTLLRKKAYEKAQPQMHYFTIKVVGH